MGLRNPAIVYGIHQFTPYSRTNGMPYGTSKVLGNSTVNITGEQVELYAGSQKAPWAIEDANLNTEINLAFKQIEDWMFELFLGATVSATDTPSTSGEVNNVANVYGTSVKQASTGIETVSVKSGSEADVKFGKYVVKAVSATTVDVYAYTDVDFNRGTDKSYVNDTLKVTASALTITSGADTDIPGFGLKLEGGSGTIGMVTGDTMEFEVLPPYTRKVEASIGGSASVMPEFGALMVAQAASNGQKFDIDCYRVKGSGLPLGLAEKKFAEPEVKAKALYDSTKDKVAKVTIII
jgi:hypothetical protein